MCTSGLKLVIQVSESDPDLVHWVTPGFDSLIKVEAYAESYILSTINYWFYAIAKLPARAKDEYAYYNSNIGKLYS